MAVNAKQRERLQAARAALHTLTQEHRERREREQEHRAALAWITAQAPRYTVRRARYGYLAVELN